MLCMLRSWIYHSSDELDGSSYWGLVGAYDGSGFVQDLAHTMDESFALLKPLFDNLWLDRATRAVFIDFTVYNANINLFCVIKYVIVIVLRCDDSSTREYGHHFFILFCAIRKFYNS